MNEHDTDTTQAADMARLSAIAAEGDPAAVDAPLAPSMAAELAHLTTAFVLMASPIFPSLKTVYTEEATLAAAGAVAALCEKYGLAPGGLLSEWGVEIGAAVVLLPMAFATVKAVQNDLAENAKREQATKQASAQAAITANSEGQRTPFGAFGHFHPIEPAVESADRGDS